MKRFVIIFLLLLALSPAVFAQVSFTVQAPGRVTEGSKFAVTYRLKNGEGTSLKVPAINGCRVLYGPSTSQSQSYSVINGQMSSSSSIDYTYYYLAEKAGSYTIAEASITVDGKRYTTQPQTLVIAAGQGGGANSGSSSRQPQVDMYDPSTQSADRRVGSNDVFVRIILSKSSAYEQEAIECTIKLYTKYSISSFFATRQPSFDGFLIEELDLRPTLNQEETFNGQQYMTAVLKKCIIFPQKSGKLTIHSGNYDISVIQYDNVNMGLFTVRNPQERKIQVSSNSASIDIKPLPSPAPEGFTGAVGKFSIDSRLVGNNFRTNDPATLIYTISGTGNIKYVKEPVIDFPSEFEQYSPKSEIDAHVQGNNVTGTMTVEYTFVPQSVGDFRIGSDKFVYFDLAKNDYVTLTTPPYNIKVSKGAASTSETSRQDIEVKNTDILHIHMGDKSLSKEHSLVIESWWYWMIYVLFVAILVGTIYVYGRQARLNADVTGRRFAKADKVARKRLKTAEGFMKSGQTEKYYEEMARALWGYLGDKLSMPVSQLSRDTISDKMTAYGAPEELTHEILDVIDECEMARYAPGQSHDRMDAVYDQATKAINAVERLPRKQR